MTGGRGRVEGASAEEREGKTKTAGRNEDCPGVDGGVVVVLMFWIVSAEVKLAVSQPPRHKRAKSELKFESN